MIRNYFKIAWRNLKNNKGYSIINIGGLTIGMTASFLILLYVNFELSYDNFHSKSDHIYRVVADLKTPNSTLKFAMPAWAVAPNLQKEFPEIETAVRIYKKKNMLIRKNDAKYKEAYAIAADSAFFSVFNFKLVQGHAKKALKAPFSIVLSKSAAKKYFGDEDPMGKSLKILEKGYLTKVTGVMEDFPENSHIKANMVLSMTTFTENLDKKKDNQWGEYDPFAYVLLNENANVTALQSKFPGFIKKNIGESLKQNKSEVILSLEPLKDIYLHSERKGFTGGSLTNIYILSIVAVFILLIACINFINLTTARSVERAKEVGIRKAIGAEKFQLAFQFIGESVILCLLAFSVTCVVIELLIPYFNTLVGKTVSTGLFSSFNIIILFILSLSIGVLAGIYPAFVLSSFKPVSVLKGHFSTGTRGVFLRKSLIILQFTISIALIIGTIIIYNQMDFMHNQALGFDKEQMLIIEANSESAKTALKNTLEDLKGVKSTSLISIAPGGTYPFLGTVIEDTHGNTAKIDVKLGFIDYNYISQFNLKVIAGRSFSKRFSTDAKEAMIINEQLVKKLGYTSPEEAVGAKFKQWGREGTIVGVIEDFHFSSLQENIEPFTMRIDIDMCQLMAIKLTSNNIRETLAAIENKWQHLIPNEPFDYYFLDEYFNRQYQSEEQFESLFINFAILAIIISCLGLLGLAAYSTLQRKREIGIRKVLGASVSSVINLLSKEFIKLIGIAFLIAAPIAWFAMSYWLNDFAYRINIQWWMFAIAAIITTLVAILTVSVQSIKAAIANPIKSLRTE